MMTPNVKVGLGWSIYVYLNQGNINWLRGLGYTAASAALCALLVVTIVGGIACAIAAYIVWTIFNRDVKLPTGYCGEWRFTYSGSFQSFKLVRMSC